MRQVINWEPIDPILGTKPDPEIAKSFNIPTTSVLRRRQKLGIPAVGFHNKYPWQKIDPLLGKISDTEISEKFDIPKTSLYERRKMLNIPSAKKITKEMIKQWIDWEIEGIPQTEIAKRSNVHWTTVHRHLNAALNKPKFGKFAHLIKESKP
jgi:hypothetical protein